jgi:KUP system potassium uptake protein
MIAALGVVFGDIGTSPLYAIQTVFSIDNGLVRVTASNVYGVISLVFWSITLIVSIKYVTFILRADNEGEGGIMALTALIQQVLGKTRGRTGALVALGAFGASLFYGDSVITPAISVLSAVEGLKVAAPSLGHLVIPIAVTILAVLFAVQRWGTHRVGRVFGPVMVVWFGVLALGGLRQVFMSPSILKGLSPSYAGAFIFDHPHIAFVAMGAVVLAITGAEALYADMGHFGRRPIRRAWFWLVFPALTLNYLGQGALILSSHGSISSPFFLLFPHWSRMAMVVLATAATVIASQSVISGAFSVTRQAVQLGFLPRVTIRHTSTSEFGQIYVPVVNWSLFAVVVVLVIGFGSSAHLATAYGVAVTGTFVVNTILFLAVARWRWRWPRRKLVLAGVVFLTVEVTFFAANLGKVVHGGWLPLVIAFSVFVVLMTWHRGRAIVTENRTRQEGPLQLFIDKLHAERRDGVKRVRGTAVYPNPTIETTPLALRATVEHLNVLHQNVAIISAEAVSVPHVPVEEQVVVNDLGYGDDGIVHVTARYGFQDQPNLPEALRRALGLGLECQLDLERASYFISRVTLTVTDDPGMPRWQKKLFVGMARNAANPAVWFGLPDDRTVVMGSTVRI